METSIPTTTMDTSKIKILRIHLEVSEEAKKFPINITKVNGDNKCSVTLNLIDFVKLFDNDVDKQIYSIFKDHYKLKDEDMTNTIKHKQELASELNAKRTKSE